MASELMLPGELAEIEQAITSAMEEGKQTLLATAERARRIGERLLQAKALLPHGEYLPWAQERFGFTRAHLANFTGVAQRWPAIEQQMSNGFDIWAALRLTAGARNGAESSPKEDRWTCLACEGRGFVTRDPMAGRGHPPRPPDWKVKHSDP